MIDGWTLESSLLPAAASDAAGELDVFDCRQAMLALAPAVPARPDARGILQLFLAAACARKELDERSSRRQAARPRARYKH